MTLGELEMLIAMERDALRIQCLFYMVHGNVISLLFGQEMGKRWEDERLALLLNTDRETKVMLRLVDEVIAMGARPGGLN